MSILATPVSVGNLRLHNRLVMPPMASRKPEADGQVGDALCAYYDEKTRGGLTGIKRNWYDIGRSDTYDT